MIWSYESLQSQYGNMCLALFESLSVINALNHLVNNVLSRCTCLLTLLKSHMDVNNAIKHLLRQVLWSITSYTLYTNTGESRNKCTMCDLSATGAKILRVHLVTHSGIRSHINVIIALSHFTSHHIWGPRKEKIQLSARNVYIQQLAHITWRINNTAT